MLYQLFVVGIREKQLLENLMEARGREAGEHAAQQHNRRDALAPVRPHCNQQTHNRDDKRNVFVVQRRAMLDKQANNDADTYDDIIGGRCSATIRRRGQAAERVRAWPRLRSAQLQGRGARKRASRT